MSKYRNEEWLREKYIEEELTQVDIAEMCGVDDSTISDWVQKFDFPVRNEGEPFHSESWLREKYLENDLTLSEIGNICGVTKQSIKYWFKKHDIDDLIVQDKYKDKKFREREWLQAQYEDKGLSVSQIADICSVTEKCIYEWLRRHNITSFEYRDEEWLRKKYIEEGLTTIEIADLCNATSGTISSYLSKFDIPTRTPTPEYSFPPGEDHPMWDGGKESYYGASWWSSKEKALERAGYECESPHCNETAESLGQNPDVHHITPFKLFGLENHQEANRLDNLLVLCRACHKEIEPDLTFKTGSTKAVNS